MATPIPLGGSMPSDFIWMNFRKSRVGCHSGRCANHISYVKDMVLLAPPPSDQPSGSLLVFCCRT